jgi:mRNA-degrading endonuclease YafQ of YafQ-DinJ toxin-antitoxin module
MFSVIYTSSYEKKATKFLSKHPELKSQYIKTLKLVELNPFHPSLRMHKINLNGKEIYSISINISYRITMEFYIEKEEIILLNIGDHDSVYR